MIDLDDPNEVAFLAVDALDRAGVPHALYGGLLLAAYGRQRHTHDADFAVVEPDPGVLVAAFRTAGLLAATSMAPAPLGGLILARVGLLGNETTSGVNCIDLVAPRSRRFAQAVLSRRLIGHLRGRTLSTVSPEDFVLLKVLSTRDLDLEDAASVVRNLMETWDDGLVQEEAERLAIEIPEHDVLGRLAEIRRRV